MSLLQKIYAEDHDKKVMIFKTTKNYNERPKKVRLMLELDFHAESFCIILKSYGKYKLKIEYNYSICDDFENVIRISKITRTIESDLTRGDYIRIHHSGTVPEEIIKEEINDDIDKFSLVPMIFNIIELEQIGE